MEIPWCDSGPRASRDTVGNVAQGVWFLGSWLVFPTLTILQTGLEDRKRLRQLDTPLVIGSPLSSASQSVMCLGPLIC